MQQKQKKRAVLHLHIPTILSLLVFLHDQKVFKYLALLAGANMGQQHVSCS
jgi:hypothetical protein